MTVLAFRPKPKKKNDLTGPRYFCLACDSDQFKLMEADDAIHCAACGARIRNLAVVLK